MTSNNTNHHHNHTGGCCQSVPNPSVVQSLEEMDFERSIWQAAIDNNVERIVKLVRKQNINVDVEDQYGYTALNYAARHGNLEAAKNLLQLGANINHQTRNMGATSLHRAVTANRIDMVRFLINSGCNMELSDNDGQTVKDRAKKDGNQVILNLLEEEERKVNT